MPIQHATFEKETVPPSPQVLLPVEPESRVPDWILDRTPTEVKAAYAAALRKREQGQVRSAAVCS